MANEDPGPPSQSSQSFQPASQGHAFLTMSSFQSMVGNFTQEALYSQLALLGIPYSNLVRSSLSDESVSSSFQLGSYPLLVSTWPGMSSTGMCSLWYSFRTPAPAFIQPNLATANSFDSRPGGGTFAIRFWQRVLNVHLLCFPALHKALICLSSPVSIPCGPAFLV